ncbi:YD repeat-containing protein [Pseudoxanthomonas winnipegensis]|nr:DUF6531 domain-containing protein [Pseudoxanthomonas winnipegensis]MDQ1133914.1 YD repeat-containing protein [Pseudoxanthomonas winnipegensis]
MVAVFTGNGLGLFGSSLGTLGGGLGGSGVLGQGRDRQYLNVATGNLVLQAADEILQFRGLSVGLNRTYNSQGTLSDVGGDAWITGFERRVALTGTLNAASSKVVLQQGDGSASEFQYDANSGTYISTKGSGAHDSLVWDASSSTWRFTEGSSRRQEVYADHRDPVAQGRLIKILAGTDDASQPAHFDVVYDAQGRVAAVSSDGADPQADALLFSYDDNGRLASAGTRESGQLRTFAFYEYDAQGRLSAVTTDLTPELATDNTWNASSEATNDGHLFRTEYRYVDDSSLRIASIRQGDGVVLSYTYNADGKVASVTTGEGTAAVRYDLSYESGLTTVTDAAGRAWSYRFDANGQLLEVLAPPTDGQRDSTAYTYDGKGNLLSTTQRRGSQTLTKVSYTYDSAGNVIRESDASGAIIVRSYSAHNQLLAETRYPPGATDFSAAEPPVSGASRVRYAYDGQDRLRFTVDAQGRVTEFVYASSGAGVGQRSAMRQFVQTTYTGSDFSETALSAFSSSHLAESGLTQFAYDPAGRLASATAFAKVDSAGTGIVDAATEITTTTYDAQGQLRRSATVRGANGDAASQYLTNVVDYTYDGLGRLVSATRYERDANGVLTARQSSGYAYLDSQQRIELSSSASATQISVQDSAGRTVSSIRQDAQASADTRSEHYYYDAQGQLRASEDALGGRSYWFYDEKGRVIAKVGTAGQTTTYQYDSADRVVSTTDHANLVTTSDWLVDGQVAENWSDLDATLVRDAQQDRTTLSFYDKAGRLYKQTNAIGTTTLYTYDGLGRLSGTSEGTGSAARTTRNFYDLSGALVGTLDAEGYLSEYAYDAAGRRVQQVRYAVATDATQRAAGTLDALRPASDTADQTTRWFYDRRGNLIGELDPEGYVTEYIYDEAGNSRATRRYYHAAAAQVRASDWAQILSNVSAYADGQVYRQERRQYDDRGLLSVSVDQGGLTTRYRYDAAGRVLGVERGDGSIKRTATTAYNAFGEVTAELDGVGNAAVAAASSEEAAQVFDAHAIRHEYDALGRRVKTTRPDGSATWYFYDSRGLLTYQANGMSGSTGVKNAEVEVTQFSYNAFGETATQLRYAGRLQVAVPGSRDSVQSALSTLVYASGQDSRIEWRRRRDGQVAETIDALGVSQKSTYDAFGQLIKVDSASGTSRSTSTRYEYDKRGLQTKVIEDAASGRLNLTTSSKFDAFGRVVETTSASGVVTQRAYDRDGRLIQTTRIVDGIGQSQHFLYDAFSRTLESTDALGNASSFKYDDLGLTVTKTSAEGVVSTWQYNAYGELTSSDDGRITYFGYDEDGRQTHRQTVEGDAEWVSYDALGRVAVRSRDGVVSAYDYDDAGRVVRTVEDPDGVGNPDPNQMPSSEPHFALETRYTYDALGRALSVQDPRGTITRYRYDTRGQLLESVVDPDGLALRTTYTWDELGRQLSVTTAAGTASASTTSYTYDGAGRRTKQTEAAGKLNLVTAYVYDADGNVVARTDASGRTTRYAYDGAGRLRFEVHADGGVVEYYHDAAGRKVGERHYASSISLDGAPLQMGASQIAALTGRDDQHDQLSLRVLDGDGRTTMTVDGAGGVTLLAYNARGYLFKTTRLAHALTLTSALVDQLAQGKASLDASLVFDSAHDIVQWNAYNGYGSLEGTVDAAGGVTRYFYDTYGRVASVQRYAQLAYLDNTISTSSGEITIRDYLAQGLEEGIGPVLYFYEGQYRETGTVRDSLGRVRYELTRTSVWLSGYVDDGQVAVKEYVYAEDGSLQKEVTYGVTIWAYDDRNSSIGSLSESDIASRLSQAIDDYGQYGQFGTMAAPATHQISYVYDAAGRQRFAVNALGAVTESIYDEAGRVVQTKTYLNFVPTADAYTEQGIRSALGDAPQFVATSFSYDAAGRVLSKTDGLGRSERFSYDGAGRMVKYQDRAGATWNYEYDAGGRRTAQIGPPVAVAEVDRDGNVTSVTRRVATRYEYDAQGNMTALVEDADGGHPRITRYEYDNRGHQIRTIFPDAGKLDASGNLVASGSQPTIEVNYDALGQAVMQKDVRGFYAYKTYDARGLLQFEIDQSGGVTSYAYNAFGEQSRMTRHAQLVQATSGQPIDAALLQTLQGLSSSDDRHLYTLYDRAGRKSEVLTANYKTDEVSSYLSYDATSRTVYSYDGYGNVQRESVALDVNGWDDGYSDMGYGSWASTYHYYDAAGQEVARLDPGNYLTRFRYTANGLLASKTEDARVVEENYQDKKLYLPSTPWSGDESTGYDRTTRYTYDAAGRKISETVERHTQNKTGTTAVEELVNSFSYDNEDRLLQSKVKGAAVAFTYDALGRMTSTKEAARTVVVTPNGADPASGQTTSSPYATMAYDAFGNLVESRAYALGISGSGGPTASDQDVVQRFRYDAQGRNVWERTALGAVIVRQFDAADHVVQEQRGLTQESGERAVVTTVYAYDASGRQLQTSTYRRMPGQDPSGLGDLEAGQRVAYNSFGEIVAKDPTGQASGGADTYAFQYRYDSRGNLAGSNESGAWHNFSYDSANRRTADIYTLRLGEGDTSLNQVQITYDYDKLGRVVHESKPSSYSEPEYSEPTRVYDRWGNLTASQDRRGNWTTFFYNEADQLVQRQDTAEVVVAADGTRSTQPAVTSWFYDAAGRLIGTQDANGNRRQYDYDSGGRLTREQAADGGVRYYYYDALGRQALTLEQVSSRFVERLFDQAGRIVSVSTNQADGTKATERYVLDEDGNRLATIDALGNVSHAAYDSQGHLLRSTTATGVVTTYAYDLRGNRIRQTNALADPTLAGGNRDGHLGRGSRWAIRAPGRADLGVRRLQPRDRPQRSLGRGLRLRLRSRQRSADLHLDQRSARKPGQWPGARRHGV